MTLLDTLSTMSAGPLGWGIGAGALGAGLAAFLRVLPSAVKRLLDVWATARERRAEAEVERARAKRIGAMTEQAETQRDLMRDEAIASMLDQYEKRLKKAEATIDSLRARLDEKDREIARLERMIRRRGDTPTGSFTVDKKET